MSSAKHLLGVPWGAARNKDHVMGLIAGEDKYTQRENLKSRLGFFRLSKEKLALAEYILSDSRFCRAKSAERGISSAKRLLGVPWDAARNKAHEMGIIAGEDKYTQRENLKSRLGFFRLSTE